MMNTDFFWGWLTGWVLGGITALVWFLLTLRRMDRHWAETVQNLTEDRRSQLETVPLKVKSRTMWG